MKVDDLQRVGGNRNTINTTSGAQGTGNVEHVYTEISRAEKIEIVNNVCKPLCERVIVLAIEIGLLFSLYVCFQLYYTYYAGGDWTRFLERMGWV